MANIDKIQVGDNTYNTLTSGETTDGILNIVCSKKVCLWNP